MREGTTTAEWDKSMLAQLYLSGVREGTITPFETSWYNNIIFDIIVMNSSHDKINY